MKKNLPAEPVNSLMNSLLLSATGVYSLWWASSEKTMYAASRFAFMRALKLVNLVLFISLQLEDHEKIDFATNRNPKTSYYTIDFYSTQLRLSFGKKKIHFSSFSSFWTVSMQMWWSSFLGVETPQQFGLHEARCFYWLFSVLQWRTSDLSTALEAHLFFFGLFGIFLSILFRKLKAFLAIRFDSR